jgi:glycerol-3-phosphate cytidylyltransferase
MRIGFTCGAFDLLHAGHVLMLAEAKAQCDWLIVGLQTDPTNDRNNKNKPVQTTFERYTQLKGCRFVDEIVPYDTEDDLFNLLSTYNIDVRIVSDEYKDTTFTGKLLGINIYYNKRSHNFSSSELRKRLISNK